MRHEHYKRSARWGKNIPAAWSVAFLSDSGNTTLFFVPISFIAGFKKIAILIFVKETLSWLN